MLYFFFFFQLNLNLIFFFEKWHFFIKSTFINKRTKKKKNKY